MLIVRIPSLFVAAHLIVACLPFDGEKSKQKDTTAPSASVTPASPSKDSVNVYLQKPSDAKNDEYRMWMAHASTINNPAKADLRFCLELNPQGQSCTKFESFQKLKLSKAIDTKLAFFVHDPFIKIASGAQLKIVDGTQIDKPIRVLRIVKSAP